MYKRISRFIPAKFSSEKSVFVRYSISSFGRTVALAVTGLIVISWLKPYELGLYNSYSVLVTYSFFMQLGIFNGLNRQIPFLMGKGENDAVFRMVAAAQSLAKWMGWASLVFGAITILLISVLFPLELLELKMLVAIILLISISYYQNFLNVTYRSKRHFAMLARINNISSVSIFVSVLFVYFFAYDGLILYHLFNGLLFLALTHFYRPFKIPSKFNLRELRELIRIGLPIFILGYLQQVARTFGRLLLIYFGSIYIVGLFSPASAIYVAVGFLPVTIAQFLYPKFSYMYGKHNDKRMFIPYVQKIYLLSLFLCVPAAAFSYFVLPWLMNLYVPEYIEATLATQLFLLSAVIDITTISINVFYSINDKKSVLIYTISRLVLLLVVPLIYMLFVEDPLEAVAMGTLCATVFNASVAYLLLSNALR